MTQTLVQTVTIVEAMPIPSQRPLETFSPKVSDSIHYFEIFDFCYDLWRETFFLLIIFLITGRTAWHHFRHIARYINAAFQNWLDAAPSPVHSLGARVVFYFVIAVYLVTLTNTSLLIVRHLIQQKDLVLSSGKEHISQIGRERRKALLAESGVVIAHSLQSITTINLARYRLVEDVRVNAVLLEPHWWVTVVLGLLSLNVSQYCAGMFGSKGVLKLAAEAMAAKLA
ncbi:hypothetical protein DOTSEDRAFT_38321 [Dothistroma septosporum NZE10]|uniref:Uncharacterized protein n=1 Tax=Dothistroma septosporum (strain NZE10 / CBS 128990) TaxID=675120 RepID=N1PGC4_DOTSN|nr:hypothetical protein DOTSEDRAFT_38321 [Dothistroma septosporum NZE10]